MFTLSPSARRTERAAGGWCRRRSWRQGALILILALTASGCLGLPDGAEPVGDFELDRYLGRWYEIVRLDHRFERGLSRVSAHYSLRDDGGVRVLNRGFDAESQQWEEAEGRAYFVAGPDTGRLKVSFFGPFYGAYNIIDLDPDYRHALVAGANTDYLWVLARDPRPDSAVVDRLVEKARSLGFPTGELIRVEHDPTEDRTTPPGGP